MSQPLCPLLYSSSVLQAHHIHLLMDLCQGMLLLLVPEGINAICLCTVLVGSTGPLQTLLPCTGPLQTILEEMIKDSLHLPL